MNLYFLVEGKTEAKLYPQWLKYLIPKLSRISTPDEVARNNYFLISGGGYPHLLHHHLANSIEDINTIGRYDYLILCLDAEEQTVRNKLEEVNQFMHQSGLTLDHCQFKVIIQNRCIETWLLGNRRAYPTHPTTADFIKCAKFYNVGLNDPELMGISQNFRTHAQFHCHYLKTMLLEQGIHYNKAHCPEVAEPDYLNHLIKRISEETYHLRTFRSFIEFCQYVNS